MRNMEIFGRTWIGFVSVAALACGSAEPNAVFDGESENIGSAVFELMTVPAGAACLRITVAGSAIVTKDFALTAGSASANFNLDRLPLGAADITGKVFDVACASAGSATPTWVADPVTALFEPGVISNIALTFRRNNPVNASVNFVGNIQQIGTTRTSTFAVVDGKVWYWGSIGSALAPVPTLLSSLTAVRSVSSSANANHACAITDSGGAWCWGSNSNGQIGTGIGIGGNTVTPVQAASAFVWDTVAAGGTHTCAVGSSGFRCWGGNSDGQLGNNTIVQSANPVSPSFASTPIVRGVSLGFKHTCIATNSGVVQCWGSNTNGALGTNGGASLRLTPSGPITQPALRIGLGGSTSCAAMSDGSGRCWGNSSSGQAGDGSGGIVPSPVTVSGLAGAKEILPGGEFTCALLETGVVKCWGANLAGQLGDGTGVEKFAPVTVSGLPAVQQIAVGEAHACALSVDGEIFCWGANEYGQLGDGTRNYSFEPVRAILP